MVEVLEVAEKNHLYYNGNINMSQYGGNHQYVYNKKIKLELHFKMQLLINLLTLILSAFISRITGVLIQIIDLYTSHRELPLNRI